MKKQYRVILFLCLYTQLYSVTSLFAKNNLTGDTSFQYKLNALLKDADSNFINYKSTEINYLHYNSKIELSNTPGNTTIGKEFSFSKWTLTAILYSGITQQEAEHYFYYYEHILSEMFANTCFSKKYTAPNTSFPIQTSYSRKTSDNSFEPSRMHITAYKNNSNQYQVVITIEGGAKSICTILNPDSTKINPDYRHVLQYIVSSFYNNKVQENLVEELIKGTDKFPGGEAYRSKYCFENANCKIIKGVDGYFMKIRYEQNMNEEQKDEYFNTLFNSIYHSLWNVFVWYKETGDVIDDKSSKIIFCLDTDHIYTNNLHKIVLQKHSGKWETLFGKISITIQ
ncbi:MAG TPA: hypothetical protein VHP12_05420 [Chitinophagaceae bacterium]|nr:hypothetical protein [Chitinophagaceae bacterium]